MECQTFLNMGKRFWQSHEVVFDVRILAYRGFFSFTSIKTTILDGQYEKIKLHFTKPELTRCYENSELTHC